MFVINKSSRLYKIGAGISLQWVIVRCRVRDNRDYLLVDVQIIRNTSVGVYCSVHILAHISKLYGLPFIKLNLEN